jgi:tetratricopeptide (TPR) repeat protein
VPRDASTLCARGRMLERLGRFDDGRQSYMRALDVSPLSRDIFNRLLDVSERTGTVPSLLEQIGRLRQLYPKLTHLEEWHERVKTRLPGQRPTETGARRAASGLGEAQVVA